MKSRIGLLALCFAVIASFAVAREIEKRFTYHFGQHATLELDYDKIRAAPKWDLKSANPPISAQRAIEMAISVKVRMLKDDDNWFWQLESASLQPLDPRNPDNELNHHCWYWLITYEAYPVGGSTGSPPQLEVAILMDGTLVSPTITKHERVQVGSER
jgi:hypothetical protein